MADTAGLPPHHASTDTALLTAVADRDADALAEAYDRHGGVIYNFAVRLCGSGLAEQVTRDVFLSLWRSAGEFAPSDGSLRVPLLVRAHTRVTDLVADGPQGIHGATGADGAAARTLLQLPATERIVIALTYFGGLTYEQVAALVQRPKDLVAEDIRTGLYRLAAA